VLVATAATATATTATAAAAAAAAAVATTAAAAVATATAAAAAGTAAAATATGLVLGSVDADRATIEGRAVHRLLGRRTVGRILVPNEPEAARTPGLTVGHDLRLDHRSEAAKRLAKAIIRRIPAQTTDKKLL
jgi:hypothetical protein